jgi:hypothetical protein
MFCVAESDALHLRVRAFMEGALRDAPTEGFDGLAVDLARYQAAHVPPYARLVRARHLDLHGARDASAIPAVPTDVFRLARVAAHPAACDVARFLTSGTTQGARGEHVLRTTETYEAAALGWGERFLWPDGPGLGAMVLALPHATQPESSLGFMLDRFAHALEGPVGFFLEASANGEVRLDVERLAQAAFSARATGRATIVLATSFALVHLLDQRGRHDLRLPTGSRVMQTGGFKGRSREVAADELRALVAETFGVPQAHVLGEYGMTELSSQLYEGTLAASLRSPCASATWAPATTRHGLYWAPPWVRVEAVDPVSLEPVGPEAIGIARIVDLANVDSAVAVQTADRVRVVDGGVELMGRLPGAVPRGCSIAIDEILGGA